jgi:hypothetical protein
MTRDTQQKPASLDQPHLLDRNHEQFPRSGYEIQPRVGALRAYPGESNLNNNLKRKKESQPRWAWNVYINEFPMVAAKRANPGLGFVTALR